MVKHAWVYRRLTGHARSKWCYSFGGRGRSGTVIEMLPWLRC